MTPLYRAEVGIVTAIAAWLLFFVGHLIVWQVLPLPRKGTLAMVLLGMLSYGFMLFVDAVCLNLPVYDHLWVSGPCFAFLSVLYMHFYFAIDRSVSIRILGELARSETGAMALDELDKVYSKQAMIARRLDVMVAKGLLCKSGDSYAVTARSRLHIRFALVGKRLYGLDITG